MNNWIVRGYRENLLEAVCSIETSTARPVNALFPGRSDIDSLTWQYQTEISGKEPTTLCFESLSPFCTITLDGEAVAKSDNAFLPVEVDVPPTTKKAVSLTLTFESYREKLSQKQPRPAWKSAIAHNNHRAIRHSLLGSVEGWANASPGIGILGHVSVRSQTDLKHHFHIRPYSIKGEAAVSIQCNSKNIEVTNISIFKDEVKIGELANVQPDDPLTISLPALDLWWPHTHGKPNRHNLRFEIETKQGHCTLQKILGFKSIHILQIDAPVFKLNGQEIFIRGACWTASNYPTFEFDSHKTRRILMNAKAIGFNTIRISGPMGYENAKFYEMCDELGLLVWQDFAFANFAYPTDDHFLNSAGKEVTHQVLRLTEFACLSMFCGNSEVQQQATMVGQSGEALSHIIFDKLMPEIIQQFSDGLPYIPSSPTGGVLPISTNYGFAHYFGYGAYKLTESDLITSDVKFASECLGLSHCPSESFNQQHFQQKNPPTHLPSWKAGVTRDASTGWDFEDIRDHYLELYFGNSAVDLRSRDLESYHQQSRVLTGFMMSQAFNFWRSKDSACQGAITWWLNDIVPGAGWGLIDSDGQLKPAAALLKWQLQPIHLALIPKGLNGHNVSLINETDAEVSGTLTLQCIQTNRNVSHQASVELSIEAGESKSLALNECFGHFVDSTYSYQFGSEPFDVIGAHFITSDGRCIQHAQFPVGLKLPEFFDKELFTIETKLVRVANKTYLEVCSNRTVGFATVTLKNAVIKDNVMTLLPHLPCHFEVEMDAATQAINGVIDGLNLGFRHRFTVEVIK